MLEYITAKCFQLHRKRTVPFTAGVNTLTGKTNAGKSSFLRLLQWVCLNQPNGDDFISWGATGSCGILGVDGRTVVRRRGRGVNLYKLDGKEFKAFGTGVPPEIVDLLNVRQDNFQEQIEPPFWFTLTPGQVSKNLNSIINLSQIDGILSDAAAMVRKSKSVIDVTRDRLDEAKERRSSLKWAKEFAADVDDLATIDAKRQGTAQELRQLRSLVQDVQSAVRVQKSAGDLNLDAKNLDSLRVRADEHAETRRGLNELVTEAKETEETLCQLKDSLRTAEELIPETCPACGQLLPLAPTGTSGIQPHSPGRRNPIGGRQ